MPYFYVKQGILREKKIVFLATLLWKNKAKLNVIVIFFQAVKTQI